MTSSYTTKWLCEIRSRMIFNGCVEILSNCTEWLLTIVSKKRFSYGRSERERNRKKERENERERECVHFLFAGFDITPNGKHQTENIFNWIGKIFWMDELILAICQMIATLITRLWYIYISTWTSFQSRLICGYAFSTIQFRLLDTFAHLSRTNLSIFDTVQSVYDNFVEIHKESEHFECEFYVFFQSSVSLLHICVSYFSRAQLIGFFFHCIFASHLVNQNHTLIHGTP